VSGESFWTVERTRLLRDLIAEGQTAQYAAQVLKTGRSAVIGKATRLGLHFGQVATSEDLEERRRRHKEAVRAGHQQRIITMTLQGKMFKNGQKNTLPKREKSVNAKAPQIIDPDKIKGLPAPVGPIETYPADLAEHPRTCRYVFGDTQKPGWQWCGHAVAAGRPYCPGHAKVFYVDAPPKQPGPLRRPTATIGRYYRGST